MRTGEYAEGEYKGLTRVPIVAILIALGLLSVVAIPRYMDTKRDRQREAEEAEARGYIRTLHGVLALNAANHYLKGAQWAKNGEEAMGLLQEGCAMPQGMRYADNIWTDERTGLRWEFKEASDGLPPRIRRIEQRPSPENWEMEPIEQGPQASSPES